MPPPGPPPRPAATGGAEAGSLGSSGTSLICKRLAIIPTRAKYRAWALRVQTRRHLDRGVAHRKNAVSRAEASPSTWQVVGIDRVDHPPGSGLIVRRSNKRSSARCRGVGRVGGAGAGNVDRAGLRIGREIRSVYGAHLRDDRVHIRCIEFGRTKGMDILGIAPGPALVGRPRDGRPPTGVQRFTVGRCAVGKGRVAAVQVRQTSEV